MCKMQEKLIFLLCLQMPLTDLDFQCLLPALLSPMFGLTLNVVDQEVKCRLLFVALKVINYFTLNVVARR